MNEQEERELWFVVCAKSDCESKIFGPLFSFEDAQRECSIDCDCAHFISNKIPPKSSIIDMPIIYTAFHTTDTDKFIEVNKWLRERRLSKKF